MKRIFSFCLAILISATLWAYDFKYGDLYYNITSDIEPYTVEITYQTQNSDNYAGLTSVTIPAVVPFNGSTFSVTGIGDDAFMHCTGLTSIIIPNSMTSIGKYAFLDCTGLTSITIPNSVASIENDAFLNCSGITSIVVESDNTVYDSRNNCNAIIETTTNVLIKGCNTTTIPNNITSIGNYAFSGCKGITSITIPNGVTNIGNYVFANCTALTTITIPNSVTSIGDYAFSNCESLSSITIPNSVTTIGSNAFSNCSNFTSVTIPDGVTTIGDGIFLNCINLTSVTLPKTLTAIGWIDKTGSELCRYYNIFENCNSLNSVVVKDGNTMYDSRNNCNAIIETSTNTLIVGCQNTTIPKNITTIGDNAFYHCTGIISIAIPESVTSIGNGAFYNCTSLSSVTIPNSVTNLGKCEYCRIIRYPGVFESCTNLTSVILGKNIEELGPSTFGYCTNLRKLTIKSSKKPSFNYDDESQEPFHCCHIDSVYIPCGTKEVYVNSWGNVSGLSGKAFQEFIEMCDEPQYTVTVLSENAIKGSVNSNGNDNEWTISATANP